MKTRTTATKVKGATKARVRGPLDAYAGKCEEVFRLMGQEGLPAVKACEKIGLNWGKFWQLCEKSEELRSSYARARESLLERMAHEIHVIADTPVEGLVTTTKGDGSVEVKAGDMLEHRKLQIETRKWLLAKLAPKYRDKQALELSGRVGLESLVGVDDKPSDS